MKIKKSGLTLLEILLVIMIIGIFTAVAVPRLTGKVQRSKVSAAKMEVQTNLPMALDMFEQDVGSFPATDQGLKALIQKPGSLADASSWKGPYLKKSETPMDPWRHEYIYESPGQHNQDYDLFSAGPDGKAHTEDDVVNWDKENKEN